LCFTKGINLASSDSSESASAEQGLQSVLIQDADRCAQEAIHLVAAIQPHGYLLGLDGDTLALRTRSSNLSFLDSSAAVAAWLPLEVQQACRQLVSETVFPVALPSFGLVELHCFRAGDCVFCEFEQDADTSMATSQLQWLTGVKQSHDALAACTDIDSLVSHTTHAIQVLSGFERVMIYCFDAAGNGEVIGESLVQDWSQSLLGLHFPASDIPAQARDLYQRVIERWMPTREYEALPLLAVGDAAGPFDLSLSRYRSVSPVHRLYQRNIGADGSMSISILQNGKLWGLIIGHHRQAHRINTTVRYAVLSIAQVFSAKLENMLERNTLLAIQREERAHFRILSKLALAEDTLTALTTGTPNIADLFPGSLGAAIVWRDQGTVHTRTFGKTPPADALIRLADWVKSKRGGPIYTTDQLSAEQPWMSARGTEAEVAGLLAGILDDERQPVFLVFREEQIKKVEWAGKPEKIIAQEGGPNLPRRSFDRWVEIRRGHSTPWTSWERTIGADIVNAINEVILRQKHRLADLKTAYDLALKLSRTDGLTGIANRRHFDDFLQEQLRDSQYCGQSIGLLLVDIDDFKAFNDHYGHVAGDQCLIAVAQCLSKLVTRPCDLLARYGGEELVLLLAGADRERISQIARLAMQEISQLAIPHAFSRASNIITVSIGAISLQPTPATTSASMLCEVDKRLYDSKNNGRNRLTV
jgi:diguanylate cyclase (GGDEF)-like protein